MALSLLRFDRRKQRSSPRLCRSRNRVFALIVGAQLTAIASSHPLARNGSSRVLLPLPSYHPPANTVTNRTNGPKSVAWPLVARRTASSPRSLKRTRVQWACSSAAVLLRELQSQAATPRQKRNATLFNARPPLSAFLLPPPPTTARPCTLNSHFSSLPFFQFVAAAAVAADDALEHCGTAGFRTSSLSGACS